MFASVIPCKKFTSEGCTAISRDESRVQNTLKTF